MSTLPEFLDGLFLEGRVAFRSRPGAAPSAAERAGAADRLRLAYADEALDLAGEAPGFDEAAAVEAAEWTRRACWYLVRREDPTDRLGRALALPRPARSPGGHLSADLTFRYLPTVHRRARALDPGDPLARRLADLLRRWPLSGVLSDVEEPPMGPFDWTWGGHAGLTLLYAERLADSEKPAWCPDGPAYDYVEWVLEGLGRRDSPLLRARRRAGATSERGASA